MENQLTNAEIIGYRVGFIISTILAIIVAVLLSVSGSIGAGLLLGYAILAFGSHMGRDCFVFDFFEGAWTKSIGMPGIIFSLDFDGILFFIAYKLIIAPIISLLLTIAIGILGTILAVIFSLFTFPFNVFRFVKEIL